MPIEIRIEGAKACPRVVCDECGQPLDEAAGSVLWDRGAEDQLYFTHTPCYRAFVNRRGRPDCWQPVSAFLFFLAKNTGYDPEEGKRAAGLVSLR